MDAYNLQVSMVIGADARRATLDGMNINEVMPTAHELSDDDDDEDQPIQVGVVCAIQMSCHVIDSCCSTCQITPELIKIVEDNRWLCSDILHFVTQK